MTTPSLGEMFHRLLRADGQGRSAKTVEVFGWLILAESTGIVFVPEMVEQAENYFRLVGLLVGGLGVLYVAAGRLNAQGFVFASLLDRPLVPPAMLILWLCGILPWQLALAFAVQDFASFLWTLSAWRAEHRMSPAAG
jgi:hypothetical protein